MAKYDPLARHLAANCARSLMLSFSDIERIIGTPLPQSARSRREWWWNDPNISSSTHVQCHAWMKTRYQVHTVDFGLETVTFRRTAAGPLSSSIQSGRRFMQVETAHKRDGC